MKPRHILRLFYHVYRGVREPKNVMHSIRVGNVLNESGALQPAIEKIKSLSGGRELFEQRHLPYHQDVEFFARFPEGSLGNAYYQHLKGNELDPKIFPMVEIENDGNFLECLIRQTHDIWHVVTGFDVSEMGELGLQAFKAKQIHWPFALVAFGGASFLYLFTDPKKMEELVDSWSRGQRLATEMIDLVTVNWNDLWDLPMHDVQQKLRRSLQN